MNDVSDLGLAILATASVVLGFCIGYVARGGYNREQYIAWREEIRRETAKLWLERLTKKESEGYNTDTPLSESIRAKETNP